MPAATLQLGEHAMKFLAWFGTALPPAAVMRCQMVALASAATAVIVASGLTLGQASAQDLEAQVSSVDPVLSQETAADPIVAKVENVEIRQSDLAMAEEALGRNLPEPDKQLKRQKVIEYLVDTIVLSKAAVKQNLADDAAVLRRVEFTRNQALMERLLQTAGRAAASEEAVRKAYDDAVEKAGTETELHLRAMLFKFKDAKDETEVQAAEAKANAAFDRIAGGEDFAAVAKDLSESNANKIGGDLGYMTRSQMGREFADVAFTLDNGGVSHPFKSQFGWHLLKVEDKRTRKPPAFESVRDKFAIFVARTAQLKLIADLRSGVKVELLDKRNEPEAPAETPK
jgi:peptidyl-prolyl cis-trans isomerase C